MATLNGVGRDSAGGATLKVARATDTIAFASEIQADGGIDLTAAGALDVGAGATATSVNVGTGSAITGVTLGGGAAYTGSTLGKAGVEDNFLGNLDVDGNVVIDGNLTVSGTTTSVDSENVLISDNYMLINSEYVTDAPQAGGIMVNYDPNPTGGQEAVAATGFLSAASAAGTDCEVFVADTTGFSAGDLIIITGANTSDNNGIYEISLVNAATSLEMANSPADGFTQNDFTDDTVVAGTITRTSVSVIRAGTDGAWETASGGTAGLTFTDLATATGSTLQSAYEAGNTISMSDAEGNFDVSVGSGTPAISLDAAGASNFTVASAALTLSTTTSGLLTIDGADGVSIAGNASEIDVTTTGALDLNSAAGTWDSTAALSLQAAAASDFTTSAGAITIDGNGGVNIAGNAAEVDVTTTGALDLNSAAGTWDASTLSLDSTDTTNLTMTANDAGSKTLNIAAENSGAGAGVLELDAKSTIDLEVDASGTINVANDAVAATLNLGTGAAAQTVTLGSTNTSSSTALQAGATGNLSFAGQGQSAVNWNGTTAEAAGEPGNDDLHSTFSASTLIGALNELKVEPSAAARNVKIEYDNNTGGVLSAGTLVYMTGTAEEVDEGDANAEGSSRIIGVVDSDIADAASGEIIVSGAATLLVEADTYTSGDEVYVTSSGNGGTAGRGVIVGAASGFPASGDWLQLVGYCTTGGVKTAGQSITVQVDFRDRVQL
jgi:hypothetical protein